MRICRESEEKKVLRRNLPAFEDEASCENGWVRFQRSCYRFSTDQFSWAESRRSCREARAELVKVDSRELQCFLRYHLTRKMKSFQDMFWIGLTDSAEEGRWVWMDGEFRAVLCADGDGGRMNNWYDQDCGTAQKRICQKRNSR